MTKLGSMGLLSGGLDSTTVQAMVRYQDFDCYALSFRCGERKTHAATDATPMAATRGVARHVIAQIDLREFNRAPLKASGTRPADRVAVHV